MDTFENTRVSRSLTKYKVVISYILQPVRLMRLKRKYPLLMEASYHWSKRMEIELGVGNCKICKIVY